MSFYVCFNTASFFKVERIEGVGEFRVSLDIKDGCIRKASLSGDFFVIGDIDTMLLSRLKGVEYSRQAIVDALAGIEPGNVIMNLGTEQLINLFI